MLNRTVPFAVAFALSIVVGRASVLPETGLALFWPAAGVAALWGLLAVGRRELALVGFLVVLISSIGNALTGFDPRAAILLGVANGVIGLGTRGVYALLVTPWWGAFVVRTPLRVLHGMATKRGLTRLTDFYRFGTAATVAATASAVVGMLGLEAAGGVVSWQVAVSWVIRNLTAIVVIAGPGLAMTDGRDEVTRSSFYASLPIFLGTVAAVYLVFGPGRVLPLGFVPFGFVFWAALRLPVPLVGVHGLVVGLETLVLVRYFRGGPFAAIADPASLAQTIQVYMLLAVGLGLILAIVQWERDRLLVEVARAGRRSREQAEDLRIITETIPDALFVIDRNGDVQLHNEAATQWVDMDETAGGPNIPAAVVVRHLDGTPMESAERPATRALAGETIRGHLLQADDADGVESRIVSVDAVPLSHGNDQLPERVLLIVHDVSEEQARMEALEAERERSLRLISDAPHGVAVLDMGGRVLQVNDSLAALAGRRVEDVVGTSFDDLSPSHRDKIAVYLERAVATPGDLLVGDWTIENTNGEDAHVSLTSRVLTTPDESEDVILVNVVDFSERRRYEERLTHLADHDALTGLPNRRRFDEALDEHLRLCRTNGPSGALLLVDLDNFKEVNDSMGHNAGDDLIVSLATLLRTTLRAGDLVARVGGDEFAVLLPTADQESAEAVAGSIVERVRTHSATLDGVKRRVTASVGAITFAAAAQQSVDPLALADMLLYDAKEAGRNQHAVLHASGTQQPRSGARLEWMARIESALENDDFELYLQPILDVRTSRVVGAEALLRLVDRDQPVSPARFIHIAERAGLAPELDRWVVRHAVKMLADLHEIEPELSLEVNLSAHSIGDESVERELLEALRRHDVRPSRLVVEATETAAVADLPAARAFAHRLAAMGTRFAIDDFGAGFGSFYYLKHLPFDIIKIDGEFVAESHTSAVDRAILRSVVGVARNLGKETVAEFVAESAVLDVVRDLGVDYAQGYFIGEPVPCDVFVARHLTPGSGGWTTAGGPPEASVPPEGAEQPPGPTAREQMSIGSGVT